MVILNIINYIKESIQIKIEERKFQKEIEKLKKEDDEKIREKLIDVSTEKSEVVPELVKAMSDEGEKIQAIADVYTELTPKETSEVFKVIDAEALEKDFSSDAVTRKVFVRIMTQLALAQNVDDFIPSLLKEEHPYKILYDVMDMAENIHTSQKIRERNILKHVTVYDILERLKKDDRFKDDSKGMAKCISIHLAYKVAQYGSMLHLYEFQNLLDDDELKLQLPKCIGFEYDKIKEDKKVFLPREYNQELCEKMIRENIKHKQERDKEISLRGAKESEGR